MRAKIRAERVLETLHATVKNLTVTLGRTTAYPMVEKNLEKIEELIEQLQEIVDVENGNMDNNY
jgi:hypothetical protein